MWFLAATVMKPYLRRLMFWSRRLLIQGILLLLLGLFWFWRGLTEGNLASMAIGFALALASIPITLTAAMIGNSRAKRCLEVTFSSASIGVLGLGYIFSGDTILLVLTTLITTTFALAFVISYLLPKIREIIAKN